MFDVNPQELLLLGAVAIAVIPPKDLPRAMRFAGQWIGKARGMARHFRSGLDEMIRQAELDEIEKKWQEENDRIMREHPLHDAIEHPAEEPVMTALPAPIADMIEEPASPASATGRDDVVPPGLEPASRDSEAHAAPAVRTVSAEEENGSELPLGLPPKQ